MMDTDDQATRDLIAQLLSEDEVQFTAMDGNTRSADISGTQTNLDPFDIASEHEKSSILKQKVSFPETAPEDESYNALLTALYCNEEQGAQLQLAIEKRKQAEMNYEIGGMLPRGNSSRCYSSVCAITHISDNR